MKKTYLSPALLTVKLGTLQMMAESPATLKIFSNSEPADETNSITSGDQVLTKENSSLWDNEW